jgi:hypothetical protein
MAKIRNVSGEDLIVPVLGSRTVADDAVVEVPDALFDSFVCQPALWAAVTEPAAVPSAVAAKTGKEK